MSVENVKKILTNAGINLSDVPEGIMVGLAEEDPSDVKAFAKVAGSLNSREGDIGHGFF